MKFKYRSVYVNSGRIVSLNLVCVSQTELTFCAGDVITVFGEIDEDGFYYVSVLLCHMFASFSNLVHTCSEVLP